MNFVQLETAIQLSLQRIQQAIHRARGQIRLGGMMDQVLEHEVLGATVWVERVFPAVRLLKF